MKYVYSILLGIVATVLGGVTLSLYLGWFGAPIGLPVLNVREAIGALLLVYVLLGGPLMKLYMLEDPEPLWMANLVLCILQPILMGLGYLWNFVLYG